MSNLNEPRLPKPSLQGTAKRSGAGSGTPKPAIRGGNTHRAAAAGGLRTDSITKPGQGTRGTGTRNRASRT